MGNIQKNKVRYLFFITFFQFGVVSSVESILDPISGSLDSFILLTQGNEIYSIFVLSVKQKVRFLSIVIEINKKMQGSSFFISMRHLRLIRCGIFAILFTLG